MKEIILLCHDPGGFDVINPVYKYFVANGKENVNYYCVGPAAKLNPLNGQKQESVIKLLNQKIEKNSLSLLVTGTSWGNDIELQAIELCKQSGIVTVAILDYWSSYYSRFQADERTIFPDYYIVMDDIAQSEAVNEEVPKNIIKVLGHPGLDQFIKYYKGMSKKNDKGDKRKILFLSQPISLVYGDMYGYTEHKVINDLISIMDILPHYELAIKFHPKEDPTLIKNYAFLEEKGDLSDLIKNFDIIIGMATIGLLHAALMGKVVISYQPNILKPDGCITNKLGISSLINNYEKLHDVLKFIDLDNTTSNLDKILNQFIWSDGESTHRVCQFLSFLNK
ncbi:hypothetical protein [Paenibacillus radicis (ex Xue et al. 2023)]|uniref:Uncharacterized protein n=1 Tax=Paenibacillus radicis (ex Xue et al. 2023) TaxID=2972489 RepID=A0ABT1YGR5_9BACL|nr:hypothetical protein [Paenibacillus radicis (ex Xue et al. 2023)]MCR8632377.1 hypothetical protein [Paenibacillus radicis (ex Xue et al. 2023)]